MMLLILEIIFLKIEQTMQLLSLSSLSPLTSPLELLIRHLNKMTDEFFLVATEHVDDRNLNHCVSSWLLLH